ncbi:hypothetical protein K9L67_01290 [Candidatus Woesearchaeota archaeon]|nr:hypothetical protein [Candidatus Woesearchaeota archaeon]MCF7900838.1 hypothetical protein [Candidatus Woesearchaeota archaeon]MCF8013840.1 hypothetical protein [Candidatus Woesearchaeota archaeon]
MKLKFVLCFVFICLLFLSACGKIETVDLNLDVPLASEDNVLGYVEKIHVPMDKYSRFEINFYNYFYTGTFAPLIDCKQDTAHYEPGFFGSSTDEVGLNEHHTFTAIFYPDQGKNPGRTQFAFTSCILYVVDVEKYDSKSSDFVVTDKKDEFTIFFDIFKD